MQSSLYQPGSGKNCSGDSLGRVSLKHLCVAHQCMVFLLLGPVTGSSPMPLLVGGGLGESGIPGIFLGIFFSLKSRKEDVPPSPRRGPTKRDLKVFSIA